MTVTFLVYFSLVLSLFYSGQMVNLWTDSCGDPGIFVRGGPGQSDDVFFSSLVLSLFYSGQMVNFKENYYFSSFQRGSTFFQGWGVQLLIPYRNPYNL